MKRFFYPKDFIKELKYDIPSFTKEERRIRKYVKRTDTAYLNQLKTDIDIFKGLLPELYRELDK